jgi:hypothetical protein
MRKLLYLFTCLVLAVSLASCVDIDSDNGDEPESDDSQVEIHTDNGSMEVN